MMRSLFAGLLVFLTYCGSVEAQAPAPLPASPPAKAAIDKAAQAEKAARLVFDRAMVRAKTTEMAELREAQKKAIAVNDVKEAMAIASMVAEIQGQLDAYNGKAIRAKIAAKGWFQTVGVLPAGKYAVTAEGRWTIQHPPMVDANGTKQMHGSFGLATLVGRINGKLVGVGMKGTIQLDQDGLVEFRCWDLDDTPSIDDNSGEMTVTLVRQ